MFEPLDDGREFLWMSQRDNWAHLYLYDGATGRVKNQITGGDWVVRGVDSVDVGNRQIWFQASGCYPGQDPYYIHYARVNFDGTGLTLLTDGEPIRWRIMAGSFGVCIVQVLGQPGRSSSVVEVTCADVVERLE